MNDKDIILKSILEAATLHSGARAIGMKCRDGDEICYVTNVGMYRGAPDVMERMQPEHVCMEYDEEIPLLQMTDFSRLRPEISFRGLLPLPASDGWRLHGMSVCLLPVVKAPSGYEPGLWILEAVSDGKYVYKDAVTDPDNVLADVPLVPVTFRDEMFGVLDEWKAGLPEFDPGILVNRVNKVLALALTGDLGVLWLGSLRLTTPECLSEIRMPDGQIVVGDGWSDDTRSYRKLLVKKGAKKMKDHKLGKIGDALPMPPAANLVAKADQADPEVQQAVTVDVPTAVQVEEPQPVPETPASAPEAAPVVEMPKAAEPKEERKQRLKRAPQSIGLEAEIVKLTELVKAPVEDLTIDQFDAARKEICALRDLIQGAASRITNIDGAMLKITKPAIERLERIMQAVK